MTPRRLWTWTLLLGALALAGCTGPMPDDTDSPEAGYDSQTERPPPAAPNENIFPDPAPTPVQPGPEGPQEGRVI